ncbi:MAG: glycosyltransferase family 4 protein [Bacteroidetes bacterium]|nr:glycosyltransferase family 4 protein [Bacteroidota bacterium]
MKKLAIISSHPIQYNAPMFALLAARGVVQPKVFYTWSQSREGLFDKDFGRAIQWDIPLLDGYEYEFVENVAAQPGPGSFKGIDCPALNERIHQWKPDALLVYGWNYKAHLGAMRYFKGKVPVYFRGDSTLLDEAPGLKTMARRLFLRWVYSYCDGAFYVGQNNKAYFLKHGFRPSELFFAPHAIDNRRFDDPDGSYSRKALDMRGNIRIAPDEGVFLFVGKLEPKKDPLLLLDAFTQVNPAKWHLLFVGNGMLENELKQRAGKLPRVHFMDFQNQSAMPAVYRMGEVLVLPSSGPGETWGLVLNEAMACGRAVVGSTKCGASADLITNGKNGFTFEAGNVHQLASALQQFVSKPELATAFGHESKRIIAGWSFEAIAESIEKNI